MEIKNEIMGVLTFINMAEKLKTEMRHSWTSNSDRRESVAEHTWMMCLLALVLMEKVKLQLDKLKVLKIIIVHDLAETIVGDIPAFEVSTRKDSKFEDESNAIRKISDYLSDKKLSDEIVELWTDFEESITPEAKFAKAIDKIEVLIQHNTADFSTWGDGDYLLNPYYCDDLFDSDPFLRLIKDVVDTETMKKIEKGGKLSKVKLEYQEKWNVRKQKE